MRDYRNHLLTLISRHPNRGYNQQPRYCGKKYHQEEARKTRPHTANIRVKNMPDGPNRYKVSSRHTAVTAQTPARTPLRQKHYNPTLACFSRRTLSTSGERFGLFTPPTRTKKSEGTANKMKFQLCSSAHSQNIVCPSLFAGDKHQTRSRVQPI